MDTAQSIPKLPKLLNSPNLEEIQLVHDTIKPWIHKTPVLTSSSLNQELGCAVFCKCENFQKTGAFKVRGAFARAFAFTEEEKAKGLITSSSGNFASGLALACATVKAPCTTVVPNSLNKSRVDYIKEHGGEIIFGGATSKERTACLAKMLSESEKVMISSQSDFNVIAGQATICKELMEEQPDLDIVLTPIGGGGLTAGTCAYIASTKSQVSVYGAEPKERDVTLRSLASGELVTMQDPTKSIADGTYGNISDVALQVMLKALKKVVLASDDGIRKAMELIYNRLKIVVEPSGALGIAAILENKEDFKGKKVGVVLTGGNLQLKDLKF